MLNYLISFFFLIFQLNVLVYLIPSFAIGDIHITEQKEGSLMIGTSESTSSQVTQYSLVASNTDNNFSRARKYRSILLCFTKRISTKVRSQFQVIAR